ncbi:nucleotide sugar dehydrogenase [Leptospira noguchii str. 1993005606]|uniref:UDP-glucose 6-dehydrogenase n=2 Tax=Leptospira noguchii TaxID=28182 RepID=M6YFQ7_9LEPT|nr:UDP-glucose/GDP-mannose dehydrogenase family protein [Leptospira noguchii]EMM98930.1 nucleotide sugar dehydrogenase [Leptospira noguchii str. 2007001578]EMO88464.1 nucleotide sugar dehydrogenase [Leptospira noguchii str. 2001034031]EPE85926.1 nucleotide sugar dehydrogenase [Leptospira noguchii str. 1993005606]UOG47673.1 UDP-glucose/GDP-mannose dehydrogenase family protein [Leptospira noguchii]
MKVCVIGSGYVGLVAGACFAEYGNHVICVDKDETKIANLKKGMIPIYEPGLSELVLNNWKEKRLEFTVSLKEGVEKSDIIFIAVGTPTLPDGSSDLSAVFAVAKEIGKSINGYKVIVDKSTVPVGTAAKVKTIIANETKEEFDVVSNPEFLKEGAAIDDFMRPERVVIGSETQKAGDLIAQLYAPFVLNGNPILRMGVVSAELTKYACNAFLATKISFANEIANLCEAVGGNYEDVRKGMGTDSRIGRQFLYAGIGYGGSCFPKDVRALIKTSEDEGAPLQIIRKVEEVNEAQKLRLYEKIIKFYGESGLSGKTFAVWGLSFKPGTDDMREAPSIPLLLKLHDKNVKLQVYDPVSKETSAIYFEGKVDYSVDAYSALKGADALLLLTEWREFREPDFSKIKGLLKNKVIFDGRNQYSPELMKKEGFQYFSIGKPNV